MSSHVEILRLPQVEARTGYKKSVLYTKIDAGAFPRQVRLGARAVGWVASEVDAWLSARIAARDGGAA